MRLLLIDPYVAGGVSLSTSLGWLSASVRSAGHKVFVLDLNSRGIPNYQDILPSLVAGYAPEMIGISVMCTTYMTALQMVEHLSEYFRGYIVLGGAQMSFEKENALKDSERADFVIVGEGEETLVELIEHLEARKDLGDVLGLIYRDNARIKINAPRKLISDLSKLPFPDYRLFGLKRVSSTYLTVSLQVGDALSVACFVIPITCRPSGAAVISLWRLKNSSLPRLSLGLDDSTSANLFSI